MHNLSEEMSTAQHERAIRMGEVRKRRVGRKKRERESREKRASSCTPPSRASKHSRARPQNTFFLSTPTSPPSLHKNKTKTKKVEQSTRSTNRSFKKLIASNGATPELIYETLCEQEVSLVFTAHPTQALRQSLLKKYGAIRKAMDRLHNARMSPYERLECLEDIKVQVQGAWRTDEIRRQKPTPQAEMRQGLSYFHQTIAPALPLFYRRIDTALAQIGQPRLPLDRSLFRFGSWMGGDRDGNPFVTADTTRDVVIAVGFWFRPFLSFSLGLFLFLRVLARFISASSSCALTESALSMRARLHGRKRKSFFWGRQWKRGEKSSEREKQKQKLTLSFASLREKKQTFIRPASPRSTNSSR